MADETANAPLFEKMPAELKSGRLEALSAEVKATLQLLIDADIRASGEVTAGTLDAIATQGFVYLDGKLKKLDELTELQKKSIEIAKRYESLPMTDKIDIIAQTFGCTSGKIESYPCRGKWRGTSDIHIQFDNGASLFIGNTWTPKAKTVKERNRRINDTLLRYNPEIVAAAKETALAALRAREVYDNAIAAQKGLKPYTLLNVELHDGTGACGAYVGWYYVTLAVSGKIHALLETNLSYAIAEGKVSKALSQRPYFIAGGLSEAEVDFVFNNVGYSSISSLYSLSIDNDALGRAEQALAEREKRRLDVPAFSTASRHRPPRRKPRRDEPER